MIVEGNLLAMTLKTSTQGIFQGDVIVRTAIIQGLRELRKNPDLLDYCFASLPQDELTATAYGQGSIDRAKQWFLGLGAAGGTDFPVRVNLTLQKAVLPCITVEIREATEAEATLADVHYDVNETYAEPWPAITSLFAATSYDLTTGLLGLPTSITNAVMVFPGMMVVDNKNVAHEIVETIDDHTVRIAPVAADFSACVLKYAPSPNVASLESVQMRGTFGIGVHVQGEPEQAIWLSSILQFILLRYKQVYFEARGFERSTVQIGGIGLDGQWEMENVYSQTIQISGYYRNYWPKAIGLKAQGILPYIQMSGSSSSPKGTDLSDPMWSEEGDILSGISNTGLKGSSS